jgi:hypothetical protein
MRSKRRSPAHSQKLLPLMLGLPQDAQQEPSLTCCHSLMPQIELMLPQRLMPLVLPPCLAALALHCTLPTYYLILD